MSDMLQQPVVPVLEQSQHNNFLNTYNNEDENWNQTYQTCQNYDTNNYQAQNYDYQYQNNSISPPYYDFNSGTTPPTSTSYYSYNQGSTPPSSIHYNYNQGTTPASSTCNYNYNQGTTPPSSSSNYNYHQGITPVSTTCNYNYNQDMTPFSSTTYYNCNQDITPPSSSSYYNNNQGITSQIANSNEMPLSSSSTSTPNNFCYNNSTNYDQYYQVQNNSFNVQQQVSNNSLQTSSSVESSSSSISQQSINNSNLNNNSTVKKQTKKANQKKIASPIIQTNFTRKDDNLEVTLSNLDLWAKFNKFTTEMIITKQGRRMFPTLQYNITGLDPQTKYNLYVDMKLADPCQWKFQAGKWISCGHQEQLLATDRLVMHPDSPNTGLFWMKNEITFSKLKLTNNRASNGSQIILNSMHRYIPRIHVQIADSPDTMFRSFWFNETEFIAVTAYQNTDITQLKIDNNPFAKGFRENFDRFYDNSQAQTYRSPLVISEVEKILNQNGKRGRLEDEVQQKNKMVKHNYL